MASLASRYFIVTEDDAVFHMPAAMFKRLIADPAEDQLSQFSNQRIRFADIVIELRNRKPDCVVRINYYHLYFKHNGAIDYDRFMHDGAVIAEAGLAKNLHLNSDPTIINGSAHFAQRQRDNVIWWQPYPFLEKLIINAALGLISCPKVFSIPSP